MSIKNTSDARKTADPWRQTPQGEAVIHTPGERTLPDRKKAHGLMDTQEALDANTMLRTAMHAMSCDPEALKRTIEKDQEKSALNTKKRLDMRLVIWVVGLVFIILAIDLLVQIF